ncbi:hypothetical protein G6011_03359 [Alternaria panax]|uniref:Amidase domain-containing protein n=1 Tax=Alternaria panax TaxID=48097 RepID=A0AAD4IEZ3_9PLEO|nr:hypothetical protein G6011_03359 [Alternaria panax]
MKPTYNAISTEGQKGFPTTFDTIGFFARSVGDVQLLADVFGIDDDRPPDKPSLEDTSIVIVKTPMWSHAGPGTIEAMQRTSEMLRKHGVKVEEVSLPAGIGDADTLDRSQRAVMNAEAKVAFLKECRMDKDNLAPSTRRRVESKSEYANEEKIASHRQRCTPACYI